MVLLRSYSEFALKSGLGTRSTSPFRQTRSDLRATGFTGFRLLEDMQLAANPAQSADDDEPWATQWRPAPPHLVGHWRSLGTKPQNAVAKGLADLTRGAKTLYLVHCSLGDSGMELLSEGLFRSAAASQAALRTLSLSSNNIGDVGIQALTSAMGDTRTGENRCCNLEVLSFSFNKIGDLGAIELANYLDMSPNLNLLSLEGNEVGDVGAARLVTSLAMRRKPCSCPVIGNPIRRFSPAAQEDLTRPAVTVQRLATRGVTLRDLLRLYSDGQAHGLIDPATTTTFDVVHSMVLPQTALSSLTGQSFVEERRRQVAAPAPSRYMMHAWGGLFRDLLRCCVSQALPPDSSEQKDPPLDIDGEYFHWHPEYLKETFFIDAFCVNQHLTVNTLRQFGLLETRSYTMGESGCEVDKLSLVAGQVARRPNGVVVLCFDSTGLVLQRLLCLCEVHQAIQQGLPIEIKLAYPGQDPWNGALGANVETASASSERERQVILEDIHMNLGGYSEFNKVITDFINAELGIERKLERRLAEGEFSGGEASN